LIFSDEASFRQDSTLHATWSRIGCPPEVPVTGQRKSVKIFGAIELWKARFHYRQDTVFNASTYFAFLEQLARSYRQKGAVLIQDNATYHKDGDVWAWFDTNRHWLEVHQLPPYSPEFESNGAIVEIYAPNRNSQSILSRRAGINRHSESCIQ
jgi:transposase